MSPKIVDHVEQRRRIRDAALRVFRRKGIAGTGLTQVAGEAGLGRSTLYHYYRDRTGLVEDLVQSMLEEEAHLFHAVAVGERSPHERLEALASLLPALFTEWRQLGPLLIEFQTQVGHLFAPFYATVRSELGKVIADGQEAGAFDPDIDPELAASTVLGVIHGLLLQYCADERPFADLDALSQMLRRVILGVVRDASRDHGHG